MSKKPSEASPSDVGMEQVPVGNFVSPGFADDVADEEHFLPGDELRALYRSRQTYKGKFTYACKELESALISFDNESLVLKQYDIASKAFDRLVVSNEKALATLDPASEEYHVQLNYIIPSKDDILNIKERVRTWLTECRAFKQSKVRTSRDPPLFSAVAGSRRTSSHSSRSSRSSVKSVGQLKLEQLKMKQEYEDEMARHQRALEDQQRAMKHLEEQRAVQEQIDREMLMEAEGKTALKIESMSKENSIDIDTVYGVPSLLNLDNACIDAGNLEYWSSFYNIPLMPLNPNGVGLLIGMNAPEAFVVYEQTAFQKSKPFATRTLLGWSIMGPSLRKSQVSLLVNTCVQDNILQDKPERFLKIDFQPENDVAMSKNDIDALHIVESSHQILDDRYNLPLHFKADPNLLSSALDSINLDMDKFPVNSLAWNTSRDIFEVSSYLFHKFVTRMLFVIFLLLYLSRLICARGINGEKSSLSDQFWSRWSKTYLPLFLLPSKWPKRRKCFCWRCRYRCRRQISSSMLSAGLHLASVPVKNR